MEYLAGPYSYRGVGWTPEQNQVIEAARYQAHRKCCAELLLRGRCVYSPIVHGHNLLPELNAWSHQQWLDHDFKVLRVCSSVIVLKLEGWDVSKGVKMELDYARELGLPVMYLEEGEYPL